MLKIPKSQQTKQNKTQPKTKPLKLKRKYSKVTGYKVNIQKLIALLYISSKQLELKIKTIAFTKVPPK